MSNKTATKTAKNTKTATKAAKGKTARINLDVPFPAHKYVKACGAYWDYVLGVWYTYAGARNAKALARFMGAADRKAYGKVYGF